METLVPTLDVQSLRATSKLHHPNLSFDTKSLPSKLLEFTIDAIRSSATTSEEQALGFFTRQKLKKLTTWDQWQQGETKQLNQFYGIQMFGEPIAPPLDHNTIILRPHWQYHIKWCGTRQPCLCCNGSKYAALLLHELALLFLLRQVNNFALVCTNQALADKIFDIIGKKLQLPKEDKPPFAKMGLIHDFNGMDVLQTDSYIKISCATYID